MGTGDERFADLLQYYSAVRHEFLRMGFNDEDARDLVQDTFFRVYQHLDDYRGESRWSYLQSTARRLAFNTIRDRHAAKRSSNEVSLDDPNDARSSAVFEIADNSDPYGEMAEREENAIRTEKLRVAIDMLPEGARQVLRLSLAGLTYAQIADAMSVTTDAVKARLNDARRSLRMQLGVDE